MFVFLCWLIGIVLGIAIFVYLASFGLLVFNLSVGTKAGGWAMIFSSLIVFGVVLKLAQLPPLTNLFFVALIFGLCYWVYCKFINPDE